MYIPDAAVATRSPPLGTDPDRGLPRADRNRGGPAAAADADGHLPEYRLGRPGVPVLTAGPGDREPCRPGSLAGGSCGCWRPCSACSSCLGPPGGRRRACAGHRPPDGRVRGRLPVVVLTDARPPAGRGPAPVSAPGRRLGEPVIPGGPPCPRPSPRAGMPYRAIFLTFLISVILRTVFLRGR